MHVISKCRFLQREHFTAITAFEGPGCRDRALVETGYKYVETLAGASGG